MKGREREAVSVTMDCFLHSKAIYVDLIQQIITQERIENISVSTARCYLWIYKGSSTDSPPGFWKRMLAQKMEAFI